MSILQTQIIAIEYDKQTKQAALELKEQIDHNPLIFQILLAGSKGISFCNKTDYLNIPKGQTFTQVIEPTVISFLEAEYKRFANGKDDLQTELALLKYALIERTDSFSKYEIAKLPENVIYYYMAYLRYKTDKDKEKLVSFTLCPTKTEANELFDSLHRKRGINLFNMLMGEQIMILTGQIEGVKPLDPFLVNNIEEIRNLISNVFTQKLVEQLLENPPKEKLSPMSQQQCDELCMEYLSIIDPSLKWLQIYITAQAEGNIEYKKEGEGKWEVLRKNGKSTISAPLSGTIEDVVSMIHEMPHYIALTNLQDDEIIPLTLAEFPSLFFEENVYKFLLLKGYSEGQIATLRNQRENWTQEDNFAVLPFLSYLADSLTKGPLNVAQITNYLNNIRISLENNFETFDNNGQIVSKAAHEVLENDNHDLINMECLNRNAFLTKKADVLLQYPYVIGSYLASVANSQAETDKDVIPDMIRYTEQLGSISPEEIFSRFNVPISPASDTKQPQFIKEAK